MVSRIEEAGGTGRLAVRGVVAQPAEGQYQVDLTIEFDGDHDTRRLEGTDCEAVAQAAILLIAVRLDEVPEARQSAQPEFPDPASVPVPPASTHSEEVQPSGPKKRTTVQTAVQKDPQEPAVPPAGKPRRNKVPLNEGLTLAAAAGLSVGATPNPGIPLELGIGWAWPRLSVGVRGRYYIPRRIAVGERSARIQLGTVGPEACVRFPAAVIEIPLCAQASAGASRADDLGPQSHARVGAWVEAGLESGVVAHLTRRWALVARIGAAGVIRGTRYVFADDEVFVPHGWLAGLPWAFARHSRSRSARIRRKGHQSERLGRAPEIRARVSRGRTLCRRSARSSRRSVGSGERRGPGCFCGCLSAVGRLR